MSKHSVTFSRWAVLFAVVSGLFLAATLLIRRDSLLSFWHLVNASTGQAGAAIALSQPRSLELGPRRQLTYEQWLALLGQEAKVMAEKRPAHLTVLAGDSISLWFPAALLPTEAVWLNQGISGETSYGLLRRLKLFDNTEPETVLVMIGINDLIQQVSEQTLLANYQEIIHHLKAAHPHTQIVVQSILPHAANRVRQQRGRQLPRWAERLASTSNLRIRELNQKLAAIAQAEAVEYLDLYPYFLDQQGELMADLTTDGLHLSKKGYQVWRSRLQARSQRSPDAPQAP